MVLRVVVVLRARAQRLQCAADAKPDQRGRQAQLARDVRVGPLVDDAGAQRAQLVGRKPRREVRQHVRRIDDLADALDRLVGDLHPLECEPPARVVLDAAAPVAVDELAVRDREEPGDRVLRQLAPAVAHGDERRGEGLGGQVRRQLGVVRAAAVEGEHRLAVTAVEGLEAGPVRSARGEQLEIAARIGEGAHHPLRRTAPPICNRMTARGRGRDLGFGRAGVSAARRRTPAAAPPTPRRAGRRRPRDGGSAAARASTSRTLPAAPALGSLAPKMTRGTRASTIAPGAHRARLERHVEDAVEQPPAPERARRLADREHLGVGGRVLAQLALVVAAADRPRPRARSPRRPARRRARARARPRAGPGA